MPRQSIEARAAAAWRKGRVLPDAPKHLSDKAKLLWVNIVSSKPPDWFDEGNYPLLAMYCDLATTAEELSAARSALPVQHREAARLRRAHLATATVMCTLAVKLRLSVQNTIDRRSGILNERGSPRHPLLGGKDH
jgi:hypothetical protein